MEVLPVIIGIPTEVKADENRVSLTHDKVDLLVKNDHKVLIESDAGARAYFSDDEYEAVGATIVAGAGEVFNEADMICKVKEQQQQEYELFRNGQHLLTSRHLAHASPVTTASLVAEVDGID